MSLVKRILAAFNSNAPIAPYPNIGQSALKPIMDSPHKNVRASFSDCYRSDDNIIFEFKIINKRDDIDNFGLRAVYIFDREGNQYKSTLEFGEADNFQNISWNMLPNNIPITVRLKIENPPENMENIARIKINCYVKWSKRSITCYKLGQIVSRNIPVSCLPDD